MTFMSVAGNRSFLRKLSSDTKVDPQDDTNIDPFDAVIPMGCP